MKLATLCYIEKDGRTLMLRRNKKPDDYHEGKFNGLGGKLEQGETPEECVIREVYEESGLKIEEPILRGVMTFPLFDGVEDWYVFIFTARKFSGELIDSPEGDLVWLDDDKLHDIPLWEGDHYFLDWLKNRDEFFSAKFIYKDGELTEHEVIFYR